MTALFRPRINSHSLRRLQCLCSGNHFILPCPCVSTTNNRSNPLRSQHNFALARQVPDSFTNSITKYSNAKDPIHLDLAKSQHDLYVSRLRTRIPTLELPPLEAHPDSVFVEDTVVAHHKRVVITRPGHESRQGEVDSIRDVLRQMGMEVWNMRDTDATAVCDGGDVLNTGRHMFVGLSDRTNQAGADMLQTVFDGGTATNLPVISVPMDVNDALHLKSIVTHLDRHTLLIPEGTIGDKIIPAMNLGKDDTTMGYTILRLPDIRACNVVTVNDGMVLASDSICDASKRILEGAAKERSLELIFVGTSEIEKSDGAVTCCSVLLSV